ncbi:hypothetical protein GJA_861 [Janthinobacterium agaricidamnosum NBRC 102515 = DSM 9628]|uniref:Uncharacterized protein n=2 Tax=Janthinobacterium agaricidamnosum TaxID=55508 RepID=W0V2E8_9BURK|nr:hypothetical protein GJA_861 [Janthinobacterium agaricidamnosum NBRC 102515 = DSM 9628]
MHKNAAAIAIIAACRLPMVYGAQRQCSSRKTNSSLRLHEVPRFTPGFCISGRVSSILSHFDGWQAGNFIK